MRMRAAGLGVVSWESNTRRDNVWTRRERRARASGRSSRRGQAEREEVRERWVEGSRGELGEGDVWWTCGGRWWWWWTVVVIEGKRRGQDQTARRGREQCGRE
jgi:hypothetical protein